jgi:hypothetical protein
MTNKVITAFVTGVFFAFFLDFFFILGLFLNYIKAQDIDIYYNVLFADHQNFFLFFTVSALLGYLFIFYKNSKIAVLIFFALLVLVNLMQIPSIGKGVGEMLFSKENQIISSGKRTFIGTLVYEGRNKIWFKDDELQKIIIIEKDSINE